ncbi:flagellar motor switch protein FliG [Microbacterium phyllosphaerae]|uniref:Flagellar motor switch protein FliG n=1 Tax=Microbacterium phyllosphaerae TaxID=124798 RepID=A0ABS4WS65_9MICO|nr:flagellar motor switch protein FliG [Microbacterium phyllosphaerae]MBP2378993.1 flagellar motor switch protein FliG [Microbacterium phyllosphaerae]MCS3444326.1 flagellar motor switch protein FliG [Microbacterium phyllosphaerae]
MSLLTDVLDAQADTVEVSTGAGSVAAPVAAMSGLRKAAIVLMNMDRAASAEVLRHLGEERAEMLAAELTQLGGVDVASTAAALGEFRRIATGGSVPSRGGQELATGLLETAFGREKAVGMVGRVMSQGSVSFDFLNAADPAQLATIIEGELPTTVAVVLANLRADRAASVLAALQDPLRTDVAQAIATMGTATQEAISIVADSLRSRTGVFAMRDNHESIGGVQPLVEIINRSDTALEKSLLASLEGRDLALAEDIRSRMVTFADIARLEDRDAQRVLRGIDLRMLALALKGADEQITDKVKGNMTERNQENLAEETRVLGPVRMRQVDEARAEIVRIIRELEAAEEITISREDEDELIE